MSTRVIIAADQSAAHAAASPHDDVRRGAHRPCRLTQAWASGAAGLVRDWETASARLAWLPTFFAARAALPTPEAHEGAAGAAMSGRLAPAPLDPTAGGPHRAAGHPDHLDLRSRS